MLYYYEFSEWENIDQHHYYYQTFLFQMHFKIVMLLELISIYLHKTEVFVDICAKKQL